MEQAITGRETPQARPSASFEGTNTYGTFCMEATEVGEHVCRETYPPHLVFAQQWQVHQDFDGLRVGSHNDELGNSAIERFRRCKESGETSQVYRDAKPLTLVGTLLKLLIVRRLLRKVEDRYSQRSVRLLNKEWLE